MKSIYYYLMNGWNHGKGIKYSRENDISRSLIYYLNALSFAKRTNNNGMIAIELECVALTYYKLKDMSLAIKYASESLQVYKTNEEDKSFKDGIKRMKNLLNKINLNRGDAEVIGSKGARRGN